MKDLTVHIKKTGTENVLLKSITFNAEKKHIMFDYAPMTAEEKAHKSRTAEHKQFPNPARTRFDNLMGVYVDAGCNWRTLTKDEHNNADMLTLSDSMEYENTVSTLLNNLQALHILDKRNVANIKRTCGMKPDQELRR